MAAFFVCQLRAGPRVARRFTGMVMRAISKVSRFIMMRGGVGTVVA